LRSQGFAAASFPFCSSKIISLNFAVGFWGHGRFVEMAPLFSLRNENKLDGLSNFTDVISFGLSLSEYKREQENGVEREVEQY